MNAEPARIITPADNNAPDIAEALKTDLPYIFDAAIKRRDELIAACGRVPETIDSDEMAGKLGDFIVQITGHKKSCEAKRVGHKEPFLAAGRVVDGFFKGIIDPLDDWHKKLQRRHTAYLVAKEDRERREREEAARIEREKAQELARIAMEAEAQGRPEAADLAMDIAVRHEDEAINLQADAQASVADLSRVRGGGSVTSLRTEWVGEVIDYAAIPYDILAPHIPRDAIDKAVRSYVRAGFRQLAGCKIFELKTAQTR